ncbi:MAG TPA: hypothetical protein DEH78_04980, partial [Solibacterales bacterium]|nr:hypothetical protein [Bryobacterales bacterium]
MYEAFRERVTFYVVYIQEAHPTDLWQLPSNVRDGVLFASPQSDQERATTASACVRKLGIRIPALIDGIGDSVEAMYTGWPDRIYVIDRRGRIAFKSAPGPYGFSSAGLREVLEKTPALYSGGNDGNLGAPSAAAEGAPRLPS